VEEIRLVGPDRRGLVDAGGPGDVDALRVGQPSDGLLEMAQAVPQIGPEPDEGPNAPGAHSPASRVTSADTSATPSEEAAPGLCTTAVARRAGSSSTTSDATASASASSSWKLVVDTVSRTLSAMVR